jgi:hypothetical protein
MCTVCRRNLLVGERYRRWEPQAGSAPRPVCQLCEGEADRSGWTLLESEAARREGTEGQRWSVRLVA